jgi:hypothetical protein
VNSTAPALSERRRRRRARLHLELLVTQRRQVDVGRSPKRRIHLVLRRLDGAPQARHAVLRVLQRVGVVVAAAAAAVGRARRQRRQLQRAAGRDV